METQNVKLTPMPRPRYRGKIGEISEGEFAGRFAFEIDITNEDATELFNIVEPQETYSTHAEALISMRAAIQMMANYFAKAYGFRETTVFHDKKDGDKLKKMEQL